MTLLDSEGEIGPRFGIRSIPKTFIPDKDGIIGGAVRAREWDRKKSIVLFDHLLKMEAEDNAKRH